MYRVGGHNGKRRLVRVQSPVSSVFTSPPCSQAKHLRCLPMCFTRPLSAPSPPPSRPPFPPPPAASSPNAYPGRHLLFPTQDGQEMDRASASARGRPSLALASPWVDVIQSLGAWDVVRKPCGIPKKWSRVTTAKAGQCSGAGRAVDRPGLSPVCGRGAGLNSRHDQAHHHLPEWVKEPSWAGVTVHGGQRHSWGPGPGTPCPPHQ